MLHFDVRGWSSSESLAEGRRPKKRRNGPRRPAGDFSSVIEGSEEDIGDE